MTPPKAPAIALIAGMTLINAFIFTVFILPLGSDLIANADSIALTDVAPHMLNHVIDTTYMTAQVLYEYKIN